MSTITGQFAYICKSQYLSANVDSLCLGILLRILSYLSRTKLRITYHWSEVWRTLLSFFRFLTTYVDDVRSIHRSSVMVELLVDLLAFALSSGENFLPDPASYDDLFYKLVETGDSLAKFQDAFGLSSSTSMQTLVNISSHYHALLESGEGKPRNKILSPNEVSIVIKKGYDTLSIDADEGLDRWERFREADFKILLKKIARAAIEDAKTWKDDQVKA
jgi:hypothetical protein